MLGTGGREKMAKYIDIDKAQLEFYKAHEGDEFTPNIITLQTFLLYYPPANVRPVVTCAECDWHVDCGYHFCNKWCQPCPDNADFYCAYGERPTAVPT